MVGLCGWQECRGSLKQGWVPVLPSPEVLKPSCGSFTHVPETGTHDTLFGNEALARGQHPGALFLTPKGKPLAQFFSAHNASLTWSTLSPWTPNLPPNPQTESTCQQCLESFD